MNQNLEKKKQKSPEFHHYHRQWCWWVMSEWKILNNNGKNVWMSMMMRLTTKQPTNQTIIISIIILDIHFIHFGLLLFSLKFSIHQCFVVVVVVDQSVGRLLLLLLFLIIIIIIIIIMDIKIYTHFNIQCVCVFRQSIPKKVIFDCDDDNDDDENGKWIWLNKKKDFFLSFINFWLVCLFSPS